MICTALHTKFELYNLRHNFYTDLVHVRLKSLWVGIYKPFQDIDGLLSLFPVTGIQSLHQTIWKWRVVPTVCSL